MTLSHLVHRIATDATFATQLQQNPTVAMNDYGLDQSLLDAMLVVAHGTWNWQDLCALSIIDGLEGFWDAAPDKSMCSPVLPSQMMQKSVFFDAVRGLIAPRADSSAGRSAPVSLMDLPLLCAQTLGGQQQGAEVVTTAWTMLYTALHLLDNIEDNDKPDQTWARWGTGPTLNMTTGLLASTSLTLELLEEQNVSTQTARAIRRDFNQTILEMCQGQHDDLTVAEPTLDHCWQIARAKSGAFFELACRAAARTMTDSVTTIDQLGAFGHHLGMLIQITDDISGLWSWDRAQSDLRTAERWTLPVAYAMSVIAPAERARLQASLACAAVDSAAEAEAREIIIRSGAALYLTAQAQTHYHAALKILQQATLASAGQTALLTLLQHSAPATVNREASLVSSRGTAEASARAKADRPALFTSLRMATTA